MPALAADAALTEEQFAALVDDLAADPPQHEQLVDLLREDHPFYDQRGTATTVRMRGWILITLARVGLSDEALVYVLEELDTGIDAYLVAAAARALRAYPRPAAAFAPFVMRAIGNIRYHDEPICFDAYGEYATSATGTSPMTELLATLAWLGPDARGVLTALEDLRTRPGGLSKKLRGHLDAAANAIGGGDRSEPRADEDCCELPDALGGALSWVLGGRHPSTSIDSVVFEDQDEAPVSFGEFFRGQPSIVAFFYTRCDNPLKCSLTITKLARMQQLLVSRGLADRIRTAAMTYDPAFDVAARMRTYGRDRGVRMDVNHRLLRTTEGIDAIRRHFTLGVNFIESLVNRHRIELYVLDADGRIATLFRRLHWDEQQVVDRAVEVMNEVPMQASAAKVRLTASAEATAVRRSAGDAGRARRRKPDPTIGLGALASLAMAFFPKCPICWAAYASVLGIAGLEQARYAPWLQAALGAVMLINLSMVWLRGRSTGRMAGFYLACAGALVIAGSRVASGWESAAALGVALTWVGSLVATLPKSRVVQGNASSSRWTMSSAS